MLDFMYILVTIYRWTT